MAVEDFGGSVLGAPIQVLSADHQNKPDLASTIARQWYDVDKVDMITELTNSAVGLAVQALSPRSTRSPSTPARRARIHRQGLRTLWLPLGLRHARSRCRHRRLYDEAGRDSWFFLTADYAFGTSLQADTTAAVQAAGGKVLGAVRHPVNNSDFSSFLLQAQASKAKVIGLANAGLDTTNAIKQAAEFGIVASGQKLAGLLYTTAEVHGLGLKVAQGSVTTEGYYWDLDDKSREFGNRFMKRTGRMPNMVHAGTYSAVTQYLKAVQAVGSDDPEKVAKKLHEMPVDDFFAKGGKVLPNGRMVHDMYLFQIKTPEESKGEWDLYKLLATVPGAQAYFTFEDSGCKLIN